MSLRPLGYALIVLGLAVGLVGVVLVVGWPSWVGRLPGDIRIERPSFRLYLPITSMLLASVVLTVLLNLIRRLF